MEAEKESLEKIKTHTTNIETQIAELQAKAQQITFLQEQQKVYKNFSPNEDKKELLQWFQDVIEQKIINISESASPKIKKPRDTPHVQEVGDLGEEANFRQRCQKYANQSIEWKDTRGNVWKGTVISLRYPDLVVINANKESFYIKETDIINKGDK